MTTKLQSINMSRHKLKIKTDLILEKARYLLQKWMIFTGMRLVLLLEATFFQV